MVSVDGADPAANQERPVTYRVIVEYGQKGDDGRYPRVGVVQLPAGTTHAQADRCSVNPLAMPKAAAMRASAATIPAP